MNFPKLATDWLFVVICLVSCSAAVAQSVARPSVLEGITVAAEASRHRLLRESDAFMGPAWDFLLREGRSAQFFLLGEQHGIAENAVLAAQLFPALVPAGYEKAVIEVSPPIAAILDAVLRAGGLSALREHYAHPGGEPAFFGMQEEAEFIAAVRAAVPGERQALWGVDYEVASDRVLLQRLQATAKPAAAKDALTALHAASEDCWQKYRKAGNPQFIYSFCGDPAVVRAVKLAWPERDANSAWILDTLEETLAINQLWADGQGWASNARRAALMRSNFLRHWRTAKAAGRTPKVFAKLGASHMVRGLNTTETFDLGTLLPELAMLEGKPVFSLLVLAGANSMTAVFNPVEWSFEQAAARNEYAVGLEPLLAAAYSDSMTLIDLRPLRPMLASSKRSQVHANLMRVVHGFDAVLIMTGSTPSAELQHPTQRVRE